MRRWFDVVPSVLRAPDDDTPQGGGSDTLHVDPGAERELDDEDPEPAGAPVKKSADALRAEQLEKDLAAERKARKDADDDARYWADRARRTGQPAPARTEPEPERRRPAAEVVTEKPEDLVDDLTKRGLAALKDRGFISKEELQEALDAQAQTTDERISEARTEAEFTGRLHTEFPEMMEDSARVSKGLAPKSELFQVAREIYRDYVDMDPSLKDSRGLLLIAARQAKAQIEAKAGKPAKGARVAAGDDEDLPPSQRRQRTEGSDARDRRTRIQRQTPDRGADDDETGRGDEHMSPEQLEIAKRLKVSPEQFRKEKGKLSTAGGRRGRN